MADEPLEDLMTGFSRTYPVTVAAAAALTKTAEDFAKCHFEKNLAYAGRGKVQGVLELLTHLEIEEGHDVLLQAIDDSTRALKMQDYGMVRMTKEHIESERSRFEAKAA